MLRNICLVVFLYFNTSSAMESKFIESKDHLDLFAIFLKQARGDICDECLDLNNTSDSDDTECSDCSDESDCPFCELLSDEYLPCGNVEIKRQSRQLLDQVMGAQRKNNVFKQIHKLSGKEVLDILKKKHVINESKAHGNYVKLENLEKVFSVKNCHIMLLMQKSGTKGWIFFDKIMTAGNKKQNIRIIYRTKDSHVSIFIKKS